MVMGVGLDEGVDGRWRKCQEFWGEIGTCGIDGTLDRGNGVTREGCGRGWRWQLSGNGFARAMIEPAIRGDGNWMGSGLFVNWNSVRTELGMARETWRGGAGRREVGRVNCWRVEGKRNGRNPDGRVGRMGVA